MRLLTSCAALAALGWVANANAANNELESRVTSSDGWVAYQVPMAAAAQSPCCYSVHDGAATRKGCDLDGRRWSLSTDDEGPGATVDDTLSMYFRVEHGHVERVRAFGASCPVHSDSTVRWIDSVNPANSVAMLSSLLDQNTAEAWDGSLAALAYHADASATRALTARAENSHPLKEREKALFWLALTRGAEGADIIEHYATTDADPKLRTKAIFALTQSKAPDVYAHILTMAHDDPEDEVRSEAFFWLAHAYDTRAREDIMASLKTESSDKVRERAVFALSQLHNGAADAALIAVLRGDYPRAAKKSALFWLGQSGSPQALAFLDEALK